MSEVSAKMDSYPVTSSGYNYYALALCILSERTPDQALHYFLLPNKNDTKLLTKIDIEDMIELKKTMTYDEISKLYNMTRFAIFNRIKRHLGVMR